MALMALILSLGAGAQTPLQPGEPAPEFTLFDADGTEHQPSEWRGRWLVLYFYPRDNTPGCTTEAVAFRDHLSEFSAFHAQVVGISVDSGASHRAFADQQHLPFPLLSDVGGQVARRYGALMNLAVIQFAKRHTYLIDPEGRIAVVYRDVNPVNHAAEILGDLKRLKAN
ncbi:MAG: peroxiredoxin [Rhodocyclaceae bacterium]|nr:peroxiredoxin [Rhodocyclaceae bacterium]